METVVVYDDDGPFAAVQCDTHKEACEFAALARDMRKYTRVEIETEIPALPFDNWGIWACNMQKT